MPGLSKRKTFTETVEGRKKLLRRLRFCLFLFLGYQAFTGLFLASRGVSSASMRPGIEPGDRLVVSPLLLGPDTVFGKLPGAVLPERGGVVVAYPPYRSRPGFLASVAEGFLRFVTAQQVGLSELGFDVDGVAGPNVERVIALPGDSVYMEDFVFKVRPKDSEHFLTEFELSSRPYDILKPSLPEGWKEGYPLSGRMELLTLGKDEFFVAGDDRGSTGDSRYWGPLSRDRLVAFVLFRYWPLGRAGTP